MGALDDIEREAAATDAAVIAAPPGEGGAAPGGDEPKREEQPKLTTAQQLDGALMFVMSLAAQAYPTLAHVWTDDKREAFCGALAPVLDKYELAPGAFLDTWGAELTAAFVCVPIVIESARAIRADVEAKRANEAKDVTPQAARGSSDAPSGGAAMGETIKQPPGAL